MTKPPDVTAADVSARCASLPVELQDRISRAFVPEDRPTIPEEIRSKLIRRLPAGSGSPMRTTTGLAGIFRDVPAPATDDAAVAAAAED